MFWPKQNTKYPLSPLPPKTTNHSTSLYKFVQLRFGLESECTSRTCSDSGKPEPDHEIKYILFRKTKLTPSFVSGWNFWENYMFPKWSVWSVILDEPLQNKILGLHFILLLVHNIDYVHIILARNDIDFKFSLGYDLCLCWSLPKIEIYRTHWLFRFAFVFSNQRCQSCQYV